MMENCFRNVQNIRKNVYDNIISRVYNKIKAEKQLQWIQHILTITTDKIVSQLNS